MIHSETQEPVPASYPAPAVEPTDKLYKLCCRCNVLCGAMKFLLMPRRWNITQSYLEKLSPFGSEPRKERKEKKKKNNPEEESRVVRALAP